MPRTARVKSESGYMHLITRGNGKQVIFVNRDDYLVYLALLKKYSQETGIAVCAYCLMGNHVHLLIRDQKDSVSLFMQKLNGSYSGFFNEKYERCGHLFQDRFMSEPIEEDEYLLRVFRYILNNPQKAGICSAADYEWSSYRFYENDASFVNTSDIADILGSWEEYAGYIAIENDDEFLEYDSRKRDDEWAAAIIKNELGAENGIDLQSWDWKRRNSALKLLKKRG